MQRGGMLLGNRKFMRSSPTDAAGDGGRGGCVALVNRRSWERCYSCSVEYGEYTRLDVPEGPEVGNTVVDKRAATAHLVTRLPWQ